MMSNEEFERRMDFIVSQQAQFASDIQLLQESQARTEQVVSRTAQVVSQTVEVVSHAEVVGQMGEAITMFVTVTNASFAEVNAKMNALVDAQIRTEEKIARTDECIARTNENAALTDEKLKNLIALVDRYIAERRNGK